MAVRLAHYWIAGLTFFAGLGLPASAQQLPPIPADLLNAAGVVCVQISSQGDIHGAYVLTGTGNQQADRDMLAWVRQLHWPAAKPGEKLRNIWFPMPVAFGDKAPPDAPSNCPGPA